LSENVEGRITYDDILYNAAIKRRLASFKESSCLVH
jgi:hypothetical protein